MGAKAVPDRVGVAEAVDATEAVAVGVPAPGVAVGVPVPGVAVGVAPPGVSVGVAPGAGVSVGPPD